MARHVKREETALAPTRSLLPSFPTMTERFEELMREPWGLRWPFRWTEELIQAPVMDIYEEGEEVVVKAEVPGLEKGEIDVRVAGDVLTVSGRKEKEEKVERKDYYRYERAAGAFTRSVRLPAEVELEKVSAHLENGVLEIRAPKSPMAKAKTRKIEVA